MNRIKRLIRDALNSGLEKLGFPYLTPHPTKTTEEIGYFQVTITKEDLSAMYERNQLAHNIVFNVTLDLLSAGFQCVTLTDGKLMKAFDADVQKLYKEKIHLPLLKTLLQARLYGSSGLLVGYRDTRGFEKKASQKEKIEYLTSIPEKWVNEKVPEKDKEDFVTLPLKLAYYDLSYRGKTVEVDASRLIHVQPISIIDDFAGESALHPVFDVLTVLKNMDWATGQAMFRHGAGLMTIVAGDTGDDEINQAQMDMIDGIVSEINAKTVLTLPPGSKQQTDRPGALDPTKYYQVINNQIAGGCNIPISVLMGTQAGALSSSQKDRADYADFLVALQVHDVTPALMNILARFQASGQLAKDEFGIKWNAPEVFMIEQAQGKLYLARAEVEQARAEKIRVETARMKAKL